MKALVYAKIAAKERTATSNKTIMTATSIGKDSHFIPMTNMSPTHENQWNNIQCLNRIYDILCGQLGSQSVADLVTAMSNDIFTETIAEYEEARKASKVVEGTSTKAEYLDDIGFMDGKGNLMKAFTKAAEKLL